MDALKQCMDGILRMFAVVGGRTWLEAMAYGPEASEASIARGMTVGFAVASTWVALDLAGANRDGLGSGAGPITGVVLYVLLDRRFYRVAETGSAVVRCLSILVRTLFVVPVFLAAWQGAPRLHEAELSEYLDGVRADARQAGPSSDRSCGAAALSRRGDGNVASQHGTLGHIPAAFVGAADAPRHCTAAAALGNLQSAIDAGWIAWWRPWLLPIGLSFLFLVPLILSTLAPTDAAGYRRREDAVAADRLARSRMDAWRRGTARQASA